MEVFGAELLSWFVFLLSSVSSIVFFVIKLIKLGLNKKKLILFPILLFVLAYLLNIILAFIPLRIINLELFGQSYFWGSLVLYFSLISFPLVAVVLFMIIKKKFARKF